MKLRVSQWLGCGLAALTLLSVIAPSSQVDARRLSRRSVYRVTRARYQRPNQKGASVQQVASIPNQSYTNYVTGDHALYTLPGTVKGTHRILTKAGVKKLANRQIRFMAYQRATTNRGSVYYKIVSQRHSVRGWIYQADIRSILDRKQQAADLLMGPQINRAEVLADESKHRSLVNHSKMNLKPAQKELKWAVASAEVLKGTPDYANAKVAIQKADRYLEQVKSATPNARTINGLITIRSEYQRAAQSVTAAQTASANHQNTKAKRDIKSANRSLRRVSQILSQIHDHHDRRAARSLFNQALGYVDTNYSFNPTVDLNLTGRHFTSRRLTNHQIILLIKQNEKLAQDSIMNLYPNLDNFDVTLMDAYQAQNALNRAQELVASLKGASIQKAELADIQADQHNINALWNV